MSVLDRVETICWRTWMVQASGFALLAVLLIATLISASVEAAGLPCFYAAVVDYAPRNVTADGGATRGLQPALFLEAPTTAAFFAYTALVLFCMAMCNVAIPATIRREGQRSRALRRSIVALASMTSPPAALFLGALLAWTLQTVVLCLSHKLVSLSAVLYVCHACLLVPFFVYYCGAGMPRAAYVGLADTVKYNSPRLYILLHYSRAINANLLGGALALGIGVAPLMLGQLMATGLQMAFWRTIAGAITMFAVCAIVYLVSAELVFSHYVQMLVGPAFGILVAAGCMGVSLNDYSARLAPVIAACAPNLPLAVRVTLAAVGLFAALMLVVRLVRAYLYHRRKNSAFYGRVTKVRRRAARYVQRVRKARGRGRDADAEPLFDSDGFGGAGEGDGDDAYEVPDDEEPVYEEPAAYQKRPTPRSYTQY
ncbi:envelope glycoprotein M [Beluga whale alphaherpesvirus 1]|uniref:Envelope glycoprotein M n=1 Tax=Beluga whale alphaherpesvirus 1 TaxID=1434720 RepID=A0A286MM71_9ALPH|nr:envelope glycoprotein M [Beluga whale alphaherpesvirus 1]ASW27097.1 envelope glycoprotein M [Beluga whale alphaherpesvirus 1]